MSLTTPHGTTNFPSLLFQGDAGSFNTSHEQFTLAGAHSKLDYLGAISWLQTANYLPMDESHVGTGTANVGISLNASTQLRGTVHYGVASTGDPNAWNFYYVADNATQKDQDLFASGSIDNQTTPGIHQSARYGLTRKREQYTSGLPKASAFRPGHAEVRGLRTYTGGNYFGLPFTIHGANGYTVAGPALLDYSWANGEKYPHSNQIVSNRDALIYHGDVTITPHLGGLVGFQFEDERGADPQGSYPPVERTNYDYIAAVHGDFKFASSTRSAAASSTTPCSGRRPRPAPESRITFFDRTAASSAARVSCSTMAMRCASLRSLTSSIRSTTFLRAMAANPRFTSSTSCLLLRPACAPMRAAQSSISSASTSSSAQASFTTNSDARSSTLA